MGVVDDPFAWVDVLSFPIFPTLFFLTHIYKLFPDVHERTSQPCRLSHTHLLYCQSLFWYGFAVGLLWEIPFNLLGPHFVYWMSEPPLPPWVMGVIHALDDGALFMVSKCSCSPLTDVWQFGVFLIHKLLPGPHFTHWNGNEQLILSMWGIAQSLAVECAFQGVLWFYVPYWWDPVLFYFKVSCCILCFALTKMQDRPIVLIPQLVWIIAPILFYFVVISTRTAKQKKSA